MTRDGHNQIGENDIAIVGMAAHLPGAADIDAYWRNLRDGVSSIRRLSEEELREAGEDPGLIRHRDYVPFAAPLDDFEMFDAEFFGFSPKEAAIMDPQHRQFLETAWEALETAGHVPENFPGQVGVFAGCGMGSYFYFNVCSNPDLVENTGMFLLRHTGNDKDFMTTRLSHVLDLHGPSINLQTACSTSLVATHYAAQALLNGECDLAIAGGVTIELPQGRGYLYKENEILSPDGACHAFDHRAQGTVFGSGSGVVVLRRLADALDDGDHIWAVIKGTAVNNDGAQKAGYLAPSVDGQAQAVAEAHAIAGVTSDTIDYVECHGTGTYLGDPIEVAALTQAFRESGQGVGHCRIGSVKTNIGHLDTAAGVASLIKASLALNHKQMPPSLGYEAPNPSIDFETSPFRVNDRLTDWQAQGHPRRAGVNSLGVGGTNAHVVLEEAPTRASSEDSDWPFQILTVSGKSKSALDDNAKRLAQHLRAHPDQPLADVAWTLKEGRRAFDHRRIVVAESHDEAAQLLEDANPRRVHSHQALNRPDVTFMFPGGGAQYAGMARDLYETEPVFAEWMDRGLDHLATLSDVDMRALWLPSDDLESADKALQKPSLQLPLIMIVEYALAQLWISWGISPAKLTGHSMGENTAACVAGVMAFEDCIGLVHLRGRLFDTVPAGGMLSVALPADQLRPMLGDELDLGAENAPGLSVASGPQQALDALEERLKAQDIDCQRIQIDIAAHSRMLEPILEDFRAYLNSIDLHAPQIPLTSNRTGQMMTDAQAKDPDYWVDHLRGTVHFADCVGALAGDNTVFLEVGPGKALSALARQHPDVTANQVLSSLRHREDVMADDKHMFEVLGRLWALGVAIDWDQIWGEATRNRVVLPTYAFQRAPYFIEPGKAATETAPQYLMRNDDLSEWAWKPVWRPRAAEVEVDVTTDLADADPQTWLMFMDDAGLAVRNANALRGAGHQVIEVRPGDSFARVNDTSYILAPERGREGYDLLLQDMAARGVVPTRVAHFWQVTRDTSHRPGSSFFHRVQEQGFYSLLFLAQALDGEGVPRPLHLNVFTNGAERLRDEALPHPEKATLAGPVRVMPRELPDVTVSTCDLQLPDPVQAGFWSHSKAAAQHDLAFDALALRTLEELLADPSNRRAALRDRRFECAMKPVALPDVAAPETGGTWVITGGFGGIGLTLAQDLASKGANLVLVSRGALPDRVDWDSYLQRHAPQDRVAQRIHAVRALEQAGAQVTTAAVDVCNAGQMHSLRRQTEETYGPITGLIHGAGVIDDGPLLAKSPSSVEDVFTPKIHGTQVLGEVFPDGSVEQIILFASSSTVTAPAGQVDYVAANEYLNAFARARAGGKTRVTAINWGIWSEVGMAAEAVARRTGDLPETPVTPVALALLDDASFDDHGNRVFNASYSAQDWFIDEHRTKAGDALLPGTGYLTLAAHALAAHGETGGFELRDLDFLRPLRVADGGSRAARVRLIRTETGYGFDVLADATLNGRQGFAMTAQGVVSLLPMKRPEPIDLTALRARCGKPVVAAKGAKLAAAQEVQLAFGPRWKVLDTRALGRGEGVADLSLGSEALQDACRLHPALMDIATGWAMELIDGWQPTHLWAPVRYGRVRVHAPLTDQIVSWVRNAADNRADAETASFDVTICDAKGNVLVEVSGFTIRKLGSLDILRAAPRLTMAEMEFDESDANQPLSPAEERLAHNLTQGIRPAEGVQAFHRALALGEAQVVVSSMDLDALTRQTAASTADTGSGQSFERPQLESDFVAPETAIEKTLAGFWQDLLGVSNVGVCDSFFDLGGHSLIAVRLFAMVKKTFKVDFPISVLFEAPTIRKCADLIAAQIGEIDEGSEDAPAKPQRRFTHLVPMHDGDGGRRRPFFLIAGMFGNVLNLRHLAHLLGQDRPFYGVQARGLYGGEAPHDSIEDAARDYIAEMRQVQPSGPYMIGGFSGGGITAYEIARQLEMMGEEVSIVVMLDTPLPQRRPLARGDRLRIQWAEAKAKGLFYPFIWAKNRIAWEIAKRRDAGATEESHGFHNAEIEAAFYRAIAGYTPRAWNGRLVLYRPPLVGKWTVSKGQMVNSERTYVTHDNDWGLYVPHVEVHEVPGDHDSMVLEPNVRVLAALMREAIEGAEAPVMGGGEVVRFPTQAAE